MFEVFAAMAAASASAAAGTYFSKKRRAERHITSLTLDAAVHTAEHVSDRSHITEKLRAEDNLFHAGNKSGIAGHETTATTFENQSSLNREATARKMGVDAYRNLRGLEETYSHGKKVAEDEVNRKILYEQELSKVRTGEHAQTLELNFIDHQMRTELEIESLDRKGTIEIRKAIDMTNIAIAAAMRERTFTFEYLINLQNKFFDQVDVVVKLQSQPASEARNGKLEIAYCVLDKITREISGPEGEGDIPSTDGQKMGGLHEASNPGADNRQTHEED